MKYHDIRNELQTGDVILFSGKGRISRWIRWFCSLVNHLKRTKRSHVGMIIRDRDEGGADRIALLESTSIRGGVKGVRLVPFSEVVQTYQGEIVWRALRCERTESMRLIANQFVSSELGKPYEQSIIELMRSAIKTKWDQKPNNHDRFCSELVAAFFQKWRMLPLKPPCNEYTPEDLASAAWSISGYATHGTRHAWAPK